MKIIIAGASGLIGQALAKAARADGHEVKKLVRREAEEVDEIAWDPAAGVLAPTALEGADAIVNLAGESVASGWWTAARKDRLLRSRVDATRALVVAVGKLARRPQVFINASAIGFYGHRGEEVITEQDEIGHGFLSEVCLAWETHAEGASRFGVRTVLARFGVVLAGEGGALAKMLPLFRLGLGGRLGSGTQWMSWVALEDVVGVIRHALGEPRCTGPLNVVAPQPVTNAEFTATLGHVLHRPAVLPAPAWALRAALGREMADEALLASIRAEPRRLVESGYVFRQPALEAALRAVLT